MTLDTSLIALGVLVAPFALWVAARVLPAAERAPAPAGSSYRLVAGSFLALLLMGSLTVVGRNAAPLMEALTLLVAHLGVAAFLLAMAAFLSPPALDLIGIRRPRFAAEMGRGVAAYALIIPSVFALHALTLRWFPDAQKSQDALKAIVASAGTAEFVVRALAVTLAVPLFEELMVRGFLQRGLEGIIASAGWSGSRAIAVVVSSLAFTVLHEPQTWVSVMALSLLLGLAAARTGSLLVPIAAHGMHNLVVVLYETWIRGGTPH